MIEVKYKKLTDTSITPSRAHADDAGLDLYAHCPDATYHEWNGGLTVKEENGIKIRPHETVMVGTGIAMAIPSGYFGGIYARSGLATKQGLRPANCVGVVDSQYRNEIMIALYNDSDETRIIQHGQRIAQMIIQPVPAAELVEVDNLDKTSRNLGGFGSTGA